MNREDILKEIHLEMKDHNPRKKGISKGLVAMLFKKEESKMTPQKMVEEFHRSFRHPIGEDFSREQVLLRVRLIAEEFLEVGKEFEGGNPEKIDRKALTKELADLLYVVYGTAVAFGLPLEEVFEEVHKSNMSKLGENGEPIYREDGKILKGPNYKEADLNKFFPKEAASS